MKKPATLQIRFPSRLLDALFDKETEFDGSLPDYCPDVTRLVRVDCTPYIDACDIGSDKVHVSGRVVYDVLYETDRRNKLRYCSFTQEFHHSADLPRNELESPVGECTASCNKITCRMLSPRRLVLHARLELHVTVCGEASYRMLSTEPSDGLFFRKKLFRYDSPAETVRGENHFEETLSLLQGEKNVGELIFSNVSLQPPQVTVTPGCVTAKTTAVIKVFYETEDAEGGFCMTAKNVPLTVTVEDPAIEEGKRCTVSLAAAGCGVLPELDQYGENRLLKASFTVTSAATLVGTREVEAADDLFSVDSVDTLDRTELSVPHLAETVDRSFTVDLKLPADEPLFTALYDTTVRAGRVRATQAEGGVELTGTLTVSMLGDGNDGIQHRDCTEEFVQFVPTELPADCAELSAEVSPFEVLPTLHSDGSISARVICNAHLALYTKESVSFLSDVTKQTELDRSDETYSVAYFFPSRTDDLWTVAKKYRVDADRLRLANPDAFDDLGRLNAGVKTLLIRKAMFA